MQLEEKRRAIEHQKKKMEVLAARQRQKLGKAAFLSFKSFLLKRCSSSLRRCYVFSS
uniref:Uncharacterized protein n=1 Tax=Poecilia mexicana TaxID=48701 RepID=A0A3B3XSY6_9TELE